MKPLRGPESCRLLPRTMNDFAPARHLIGLFLAGSPLACQEPPESDSEPVKQEEVIARVNGNTVFRTDFKEYLDLSEGETAGEALAARFQHFLVQLILFHEAEREGYRLPEQLIQERTSAWEAAGVNSVAAQKWNQRFLTVQAYIRSRLDSGEQITLKELRRHYVEHEREFLVNEQLRVLEILVEDLARAEHFHEQLIPGDFRRFRDLAEAHSVGSHDRGELGVFEPGQLPPLFEKVIFSLKVGEISPVFSSQFGYHIFTLEERTPKHYQKFYEVQEQIFNLMLTEKERLAVDAFVQDRITQAAVEILDERLEGFWRSRNVELG